jgi:hypothetical protein
LIAVVTVITLERKNRDDRKEKIVKHISNRVEKKTKQKNTNIRKEKEGKKKKTTTKKKNPTYKTKTKNAKIRYF